ncbi:hypothetical protein IJI18_02350 [Candidatus Saccharibacteria bacterium]|nr:hypothetical protein [Candidatus Saccharibacteria bacterium]
MQKIDDFLESLLKKKGLSDVDPEIKKDLMADMRNQLEAQLNRAAIQSLSEEKAQELANLIGKPDFTTEKLTEFMQKSGVDFEKIALETLQQFKKLYLGEEA